MSETFLYTFSLIYFFLLCFGCVACGIFVPWPRIKHMPPVLEVQSQLLDFQGSPCPLALFFLDNLGKGLSVYLWISMLEVMVVYAPPLHYCVILDLSIYLLISVSFILFCFCVVVLCPIVSSLMTCFSISCKTCLVVMNTFSFYLSFFLENCFAKYVNGFLGWQFFFFLLYHPTHFWPPTSLLRNLLLVVWCFCCKRQITISLLLSHFSLYLWLLTIWLQCLSMWILLFILVTVCWPSRIWASVFPLIWRVFAIISSSKLSVPFYLSSL